MATILGTKAWSCGNPECPEGGWHRATFRHYADRDEFTEEEYGDGAELEVDESQVPSAKEMEASWLAYSVHVATTGDDPLRAFPAVPRTVASVERWEVLLRPMATGMVELVGLREAGGKAWRGEPPVHVLNALGVIPDTGTMGVSWEELCRDAPTLVANEWFAITLNVQTRRDPEQVRHELRLAACDDIVVRKTADDPRERATKLLRK